MQPPRAGCAVLWAVALARGVASKARRDVHAVDLSPLPVVVCLPTAITRDSRHKRRNTGGRRNVHKKKRKYETGRQAAMTKLITTQGQQRRVSEVRTRGGNKKFRALRLDTGNYSWGTESTFRWCCGLVCVWLVPAVALWSPLLAPQLAARVALPVAA